MRKQTVRDIFDTRLSGIEVTGTSKQAIMKQIYGEEKPMKRKLSTTIVAAALLIVLLAATAVATHLFTRSSEADAIQAARQALMETYGLTPPTLGLFLAEAEPSGGSWDITFTSHAAELFDRQRIGSYAVKLRDGSAQEVTWTHDGADPAQWQGAGLDAPIWGQAQLLEALTAQEEDNLARIAAAQARWEQAQETVTAAPGALTEEEQAQAIAQADQALIDTYGFTGETLPLFTADVLYPSETHGEGYLTVYYSPDYEQSLYGAIQSKLGSYYVTIATDSDEIANVLWSGGQEWDDKAYTQSNWGSAPAFHAKLLPWVLALQEEAAAILAPFGLDAVPFIEAAAFDQVFRDAGFPADEGFHRYPPEADELPYEEALKLAIAALCQDTGIAEDKLRPEGLSAERIMHDGNPKYSFMFTVYQDGFCAVYAVYMDARTGVMENIEVVTGGNG